MCSAWGTLPTSPAPLSFSSPRSSEALCSLSVSPLLALHMPCFAQFLLILLNLSNTASCQRPFLTLRPHLALSQHPVPLGTPIPNSTVICVITYRLAPA